MVYTDQTSRWLLHCVTVKASDHENANGRYEAQVFYIDAKGQKNVLFKKAFSDHSHGQPTVPASANLSIPKQRTMEHLQ